VIIMMGKKNGNPSVSTPNTTGNNATDAAAMGTVGTSSILAGGNLCGNRLVMEL